MIAGQLYKATPISDQPFFLEGPKFPHTISNNNDIKKLISSLSLMHINNWTICGVEFLQI